MYCKRAEVAAGAGDKDGGLLVAHDESLSVGLRRGRECSSLAFATKRNTYGLFHIIPALLKHGGEQMRV
ncbi:hypothetical protein CFL01nite_15000 [Corynebacterium flavescens]|uniref:Uncharacterized protein n=1 Tax=Corynebacterium flavescens TaxID=28028 RepID=A0AB73B813_CORFL|nr:hypothetical protein CFL01nite_15000 [Corynebacterium flavescens]